jgi:hypothetical protein
MFAVVTGTTISCSLCMQYLPVLSLSFWDIYDVAPLCLLCHWHNYFLLHLLVLSLSFLNIYAVAPLYLLWSQAQLFPAAWACSTCQYSVYLSEISMMWHHYVCCATGTTIPAALASAQSIFLRYLCCGTIMLAVVLQPGHAVLASAQTISLRCLKCGAIMFDVVTDTTISCSLGMQYLPVLSLSFLDI